MKLSKEKSKHSKEKEYNDQKYGKQQCKRRELRQHKYFSLTERKDLHETTLRKATENLQALGVCNKRRYEGVRYFKKLDLSFYTYLSR